MLRHQNILTNTNPYASPSGVERSEEIDLRGGTSANRTMRSGTRLAAFSVALIPLSPGLLFGGLIVFFTPVNIIEGRGTWFALCPVAYGLLQLASLCAWLRPTCKFGRITFDAWSAATILCSVVVIAEMQRQIMSFDGNCGNVLLGPIFMQISACGTIVGMSVLLFAYRSASKRASGSKVSYAREPVHGREPDGGLTLDYCSICRCEVEVDNDYRCPNCRWPV